MVYHTLSQALSAGTTVITPNDRLARALLDYHAQHAPKAVTEKPACYAYNAWLQQLYLEAVFHTLPQQSPFPLLLTRHQIFAILKKILVTTGTPGYRGLITAIDSTRALAQQWNIAEQTNAYPETEQTRFFSIIMEQYHALLAQYQAITPEGLVPFLLQHPVPLPEKTIWLCFDQFTPQQKTLQDHLVAQNKIVRYHDFNKPIATVYQAAASQPDAEYHQIIQWIQSQKKLGKQSIGVVIPNLEQVYKPLTRLLNQYFHPHSYNLSLGSSLDTVPLIAHALLFLELDFTTLSHQEATCLLSSPFVQGAETSFEQARAFLHNEPLMQDLHFDGKYWLQCLEHTAPHLANTLKQIPAYPEHAKTQDWRTYFLARLQYIGFPGNGALYSESYQACQRFLQLLDEWDSLSICHESMTRKSACAHIRALAENTLFKPQLPAASIHIIGLLEASGYFFDALWIAGLDDTCLPNKTKFSPFLPIELQKARHFPYSCPHTEYALAKKILERFRATTHTLVLSYAEHIGDEPARPSPLLAECFPDARSFTATSPSHTQWQDLRITMRDPVTLPHPATEEITGTTRLLAYQAQCPFRAFAALRLQSNPKIRTSEGISRRDLGIIIHRSMEILWQLLQKQANLLNISHATLCNHIQQALHIAWLPYQARRMSCSPTITALEIQKLSQRLQSCLLWEKTRAPFTVSDIEKKYTITLSDIHFQVRIDRKDQLENGEAVLIDYKIKIPDTTPWFEEQPQEGQILLYALLDPAISTITFLQLAYDEPIFKGLTHSVAIAEGIKKIDSKKQDWATLKENWKKRLEALADAFKNGIYHPEPKPSQCTPCAYQNLCRAPFDPKKDHDTLTEFNERR